MRNCWEEEDNQAGGYFGVAHLKKRVIDVSDEPKVNGEVPEFPILFYTATIPPIFIEFAICKP